MIEVIRERHETPENVARRLCLAGGMNRYGEANYRVVGGWNRLGWICGEFVDRGLGGGLISALVGVRLVLKEGELNRCDFAQLVPAGACESAPVWEGETTGRA